MVLLCVFGFFAAMGLYFLAASVLHLPTHGAERAMAVRGRKKASVSQLLDHRLFGISVWVSDYIHLDEYKRNRMEHVLKAAGMNMSPEVYRAFALVKGGSLLVLCVPCMFLMPLLSPVLVFIGIAVYFKESNRAEEALKSKREEIERELPRFVSTIEQELKSSRDVLAILEHFKRNAGVKFREELDILTADMRSSSYEAALTRFEARLNSTMLSDVVRGLVGVLRGDNSAAYFQLLAHDFKQLELQRLKKEAQKIPPRIRIFSLLMLLCFLLTYLAIIGYEIIHSLGGMF